jgi:hypothetical protein
MYALREEDISKDSLQYRALASLQEEAEAYEGGNHGFEALLTQEEVLQA